MFENTAGTMAVVDGQVLVDIYGETDVATLGMGRFGRTLWLDTDDAGTDFDGDDDDDAARLFAVFQLKKTGTLVNDLVGVWEATVFRYIKEPGGTEIVDLIAEGVTFTFTVEPDSRYTAVVNGDADTEAFIVEGDEFLTRNGESVALTFQLVEDQLSLGGPSTYDFDGEPTTPEEPATLELVMVRQ